MRTARPVPSVISTRELTKGPVSVHLWASQYTGRMGQRPKCDLPPRPGCCRRWLLTPYLRGAPPGLPFVLDEATVTRGLNFTLQTSLGALDLLGEIIGGGRYHALQPHTDDVELEDFVCEVVSLPTLTALKRVAGRPRDNEALAFAATVELADGL